MSAVLMRAENLTKTFRSGDATLNVFSGLSMEVLRGERLALIGESGAGKSTLLYLLSGLDRPTSGRIFFESYEISSMNAEQLADFRNRKLGFVWQNHNLLPEFTAVENVMMPLLMRGTPLVEARRRASQRLEETGIGARAEHRAGEMSGGEQQRVALARALVTDPLLLVADEPTGNLDFRTAEMIFGLLENLQRTRQLTTILVTHNLTFAQRCDRILRLEGGCLQPADRGPGPLAERDAAPRDLV
jgi:lipoprotein-releasing system ATP-binding protein